MGRYLYFRTFLATLSSCSCVLGIAGTVSGHGQWCILGSTIGVVLLS